MFDFLRNIFSPRIERVALDAPTIRALRGGSLPSLRTDARPQAPSDSPLWDMEGDARHAYHTGTSASAKLLIPKANRLWRLDRVTVSCGIVNAPGPYVRLLAEGPDGNLFIFQLYQQGGIFQCDPFWPFPANTSLKAIVEDAVGGNPYTVSILYRIAKGG